MALFAFSPGVQFLKAVELKCHRGVFGQIPSAPFTLQGQYDCGTLYWGKWSYEAICPFYQLHMFYLSCTGQSFVIKNLSLSYLEFILNKHGLWSCSPYFFFPSLFQRKDLRGTKWWCRLWLESREEKEWSKSGIFQLYFCDFFFQLFLFCGFCFSILFWGCFQFS